MEQFYYQPQEIAFCPDIVKDWPKIILHPTDKNGRLKRVDGNPEEYKKLLNKAKDLLECYSITGVINDYDLKDFFDNASLLAEQS